jgi:hypothetical protein
LIDYTEGLFLLNHASTPSALKSINKSSHSLSGSLVCSREWREREWSGY